MGTANQNKTNKAEQISRLPGEIIEEILTRIQVKSLLKFRCVSKSWCSLIGCKRFVEIHLRNSRKNPSLARHRILLNSYSNPYLKHCSLRSLMNDPIAGAYAFDDPINDFFEDTVRVLGCCNGLICILTCLQEFFLWNPSTRVFKQLPDLDDILNHGFIVKYGFGDNESNGDYKIFMTFSLCLKSAGHETVGNVYSLKTNSWNRIEEKDVDTFKPEGKFVSGKLHWPREIGCNSGWEIVSFDLTSELYGMLRLPSDMEAGFLPSLGEFDGCLCMLCDYKNSGADVWVLKQYGEEESWSKMVTVPHLRDPWERPFSSPFGMGENREMLLSQRLAFIIYCPKDDRLWCPKVANLVQFRCSHVYIESLVSLDLDCEPQRPTQASSDGENLPLPLAHKISNNEETPC